MDCSLETGQLKIPITEDKFEVARFAAAADKERMAVYQYKRGFFIEEEVFTIPPDSTAEE